MRIPRLFVESLPRDARAFALTGDRSHYLARVLRLGPGDALRLFDGQGYEVQARIVSGPRSAMLVQPGEPVESVAESPLRVHLVQGLCRTDRMDLVLQKATELGVHRISVALCKRTQVRLNRERLLKRMAHWRGVVISAAEQSGRAWVPTLDEPAPLATVITGIDQKTQRIFLDSRADMAISALHCDTDELALVIGPEGGLSKDEREQLREQGVSGVRMGSRILRTETAGLAALAALQTRFGDF